MYFMYNQPNDNSNANTVSYPQQNDNPMKDIKKNYGDYLRLQIKQNDEKKRQEKYGTLPSQNEINQYGIHDNQNYQQQPFIPDKQNYESIINYSNQESYNNKPIPDKMYGQYLKQQIEDKRKTNGMNLDFKQSKVQELQEKMAAKQENPYGKGGGGAPLIGINGQVISSRKPDSKQLQQNREVWKIDQNQDLIGQNQQISYNFDSITSLNNQKYQSQSNNQNQNLQNYSNSLSFQPLVRNNTLNKGDIYTSNNNHLNLESPKKYDNEPPKNISSENSQNFRRNNKRLLERENQNDADLMRKEKQKQDINQALQEQIMEKDRKKQQDKQREKDEELKIEERVKKERELLEKQIKEEEFNKKQKAAQIIKENDDVRKDKKNKIIPYHLDQPSPQKIEQNNHYIPQDKQSLETNSIQNFITQVANNPTNFNEFYSMFSQQHQQQQQLPQQQQQLTNYFSTNSFQNPTNSKSGYINQINNMYPMANFDTFYSTNNYRDILLQNQRNGLSSQEQRNRDIIPEIDNMRQQIQNQYKNLQQDVQRAKEENYYAIDERNKQGIMNRQQYQQQFIGNGYNTINDYEQNNTVSQNNPYNIYSPHQQIPRSNNNKSREASGYSSQRRQINSADQQYLMQQRQPIQELEDYNIQSLNAESKMIPMDLIDHLRAKDKLTMSQLINYDQDYTQNSIIQQQQDQYPNKQQNTLNQWEIPTINSEITKDIDQILNHQSQQIAYQQKQDELNRQKNYSSQSQQRNKMKSETTFNLAAKGLFGQNSNQNPSLNRLPSSYEDTYKKTNVDSFNLQNQNGNSQNTANSFYKQQNLNSNGNYFHQQQDAQQNLNMSDLQYKLQQENQQIELNLNQNKDYYQDSRDQNKVEDEIFDYKKENQRKLSSEVYGNVGVAEDSDEIKKQKAIREIKEKFHLSTVNEEFNEKTKYLSTILETGKYQDNKELYESLKQVEDPNFFKLDELIKQFKTNQIL